jgi:glycosyltransferase 2 family protein
MKRNILNIGIGIIIGALFIWLSLRNVDTDELFRTFGEIRLGWIFPYLAAATASIFIRAERWRMLIQKEESRVRLLNVSAGVTFGMLVNYAIPRLGEVSRALYVARNEKLSSSNIFGTVVLERIVDLFTMFVFLLAVLIVIAADGRMLRTLFGDDTIDFLQIFFDPLNATLLFTGMMLSLGLGFWILKQLLSATNREKARTSRIREMVITFTDGLVSIRDLKNWPRFIILTALMWGCYILMSYFPFYAFSLTTEYGLTLGDAAAVTAIASIGVVLPSPGGVGTYHYFVVQTLLVLCSIPASTGLAYAVVTHGAMMVVIVSISLILFFTQYLVRKSLK